MSTVTPLAPSKQGPQYVPPTTEDQPLINPSELVLLKKHGLNDIGSLINDVGNLLDAGVAAINEDPTRSDFYKDRAKEQLAHKQVKQLATAVKDLNSQYAVFYEAANKRIAAESKIKGGIDAVILQSAQQLMLAQDMSVADIAATNDPDLIRAALLLPASKYLLFKNDSKKLGVLRNKLDALTLGDDYEQYQRNKGKVEILTSLHSHLSTRATKHLNKAVEMTRSIS